MANLVQNLDAIRLVRFKDILKFSVKCALTPQCLTAGDYSGLRVHRLSNEEIVEIVSMCAFSMYAIAFANATRVAIDDEFTGILQF